MTDKEFSKITNDILTDIGQDETKRLFSYEYCELEPSFVAFVNNYYQLKDLPEDFTIIDIGSYQSFQGNLFKNHAKYIGVEPAVPVENRLRQDNAEYYQQTGQTFIRETLPELGLDPEKTFAVCSAVPDKNVTKEVKETFKYYKVAYPGEKTVASYPKDFMNKKPDKLQTRAGKLQTTADELTADIGITSEENSFDCE